MRRSLVPLAVALFAAAALVAGAPPVRAIAAYAASVRVLAAQPYEGTIANAGDRHALRLDDFTDQTATIVVRAPRGSALRPDVQLLDGAGQDVTAALTGFRRDTARSVVLRNATVFAAPGPYTLVVTGKDGTTGRYTLKAIARVKRAFRGSGFIENGGGSAAFTFFAPTDATVKLTVLRGRGSSLAAKYVSVAGADCADPRLVPGVRAGTASFVAPFAAEHRVQISGDGGTAGSFVWRARVVPARRSRKTVRLNGGAASFPGPGPAPARSVTSAGQTVVGFDADETSLCWRGVKTQGGGPNLGKNSVSCSTLLGRNLPGLGDFAVDPAPPEHCFALGRTHVVAVADDALSALPRSGGQESVTAGIGSPVRVLADDASALVLQTASLTAYPLDGGDPAPFATEPGTYLDLAFGGKGLVYAYESGGGALEVRTVSRAGDGDTLVGTLGANPGFRALAARGADVFVATDDGASGSNVYVLSACHTGPARPIATLAETPVLAMCTDEANLYLLADDPDDGVRLLQISRGGGEATVLARSGAGFTYATQDMAAVKGAVYLLAKDGGNLRFYRVARR